jgi:hypothetical protein
MCIRDRTNDMGTVERLRAGAGKAVADMGRGVGQMVGLVDRADVADSRKNDAALMDTTSGKVGNLLGNVAMAAPTALIPGANTIAGAGAIGAGMGLLQPSVSTGETITNTAVGGVAGAAIPAAIRGAQVAKAAIEPFYQRGRNQIIGRALGEASGGREREVLQALRGAQEIVPGSAPTAAQAANNPGIAALSRTATQTDPVAMNQMAMRMEAQNDARLGAIQGIMPDRQAAQQARDQAAAALYGQANDAPVEMTQRLAAILQRPSAQNPMTRAQQIAAESGEQFNPQALTGLDAHRIKMGLDDVVGGGPMGGIGGNELRAIQGTRGDFLGELERQIPVYGQARQAYAQGSRPINQADVIERIAGPQSQGGALSFRGDLTPAAYARALSDRTAQRATGRETATLANTLEPGQLQTLNNVGADLMRADFANTAGKGVGSDTVQKLAYSNILAKSGLPSFIKDLPGGGVVGRMADIGYRRSNDEMRQQLAQALLDPARSADLLQAGMVTPQMQALIAGLARSGAAAGASVPGLVQANQQ